MSDAMNYRYTPEEIGQLNAQIDRLRSEMAEYDRALDHREEEVRRLRALLKEVDSTWPVATSELRERVRKEIQTCDAR